MYETGRERDLERKRELERERERERETERARMLRALPRRAAYYHGGAKSQEGQKKSLFWPSRKFPAGREPREG